MSKPTLTYFPARGRAELIRLVLAEAGVDYEERPVGHGTPPVNGHPTDFQALKDSGTLPFGAVPVWEEPDGFRLAQSLAIARHLARAHGLWGHTPHEAALCDQILGAFDDVRGDLRRLATVEPAQRAAVRQELLQTILPRWLGYLDRLLGEQYFVGETASVADLAVWYLLELMTDNGFGAPVAKHPRLEAFARRIAARPHLAAYLSSSRRFPLVPLP